MAPIPQLRFISITLHEDGVLVLRYSRPEAGNAITTLIIKELLIALQWAVGDPRVKVIVQTGEGRFFTTGRDMSSHPDNQGAEDSPLILYHVNKLMINCEKITIAAVNGPGVGYGASSIGLFDLVYVVPDAYFFAPFIKWGLCAEACSSHTFASAMGRQRASHLIFTGEKMPAQELKEAGLVSKIIPKGNFLQDVLTIAHQIAAKPTQSVKANKQLMSAFWREELHKANDQELVCFQELLQTDAAKRAGELFAAEQALKKARKQGRVHNL
ncbi:ClpP/crotonase-like domain-containing protein [Aspergillus venezuelensis]